MHPAHRHRLAIGCLGGQRQSAVVAGRRLVPLACGFQSASQRQPAFPVRGRHLRGRTVEMHHLVLTAQLARQMPSLQPAPEKPRVLAQQHSKTIPRSAHIVASDSTLRPQQCGLRHIRRLLHRLCQSLFGHRQLTALQRLPARFQRVVVSIGHMGPT